jgi:hypothetical protein
VASSTQDDPTAVSKPLGYLHQDPFDACYYKQPPDLDYNILALHVLPDMAAPLWQDTSPLSLDSDKDTGGATTWPQVPLERSGTSFGCPMLCGHLKHMLAWSTTPKDPGKLQL